MGDWPFSLNINTFFNSQTRFDLFNEKLTQSKIRFLNNSIGLKSLFKSILNFNYNFSLIYSKSIIKSPEYSKSSARTFLNKFNLYITSEHLFNSTFTLNSMISNNGKFRGSFLDISINRKFGKNKFLAELSGRNILNKKYLANTILSPLYKQESQIELRGAEFFIKLRYEFR